MGFHSLVPATLHVGVAKLAIDVGRDMVTASYESPAMKALHQEYVRLTSFNLIFQLLITRIEPGRWRAASPS